MDSAAARGMTGRAVLQISSSSYPVHAQPLTSRHEQVVLKCPPTRDGSRGGDCLSPRRRDGQIARRRVDGCTFETGCHSRVELTVGDRIHILIDPQKGLALEVLAAAENELGSPLNVDVDRCTRGGAVEDLDPVEERELGARRAE